MLAGLCINIPMLRPFYLQWRAKYKTQSMSNSGRVSALKRSGTGGLGSQQARPGHYTQWMELVSRTLSTRAASVLGEMDANNLQHDKDHTNVTVTADDASSERKLTSEPMPFDAIQVSKDFVITRN